jgi:hypothetical protein
LFIDFLVGLLLGRNFDDHSRYPYVLSETIDKIVISEGYVTVLANFIRENKLSMSIFDGSKYAARIGNMDIIQFLFQKENQQQDSLWTW